MVLFASLLGSGVVLAALAEYLSMRRSQSRSAQNGADLSALRRDDVRAMPADAWLLRRLRRMRRAIAAKPGDCCVFCSYGTVPCPPKQAGWPWVRWYGHLPVLASRRLETGRTGRWRQRRRVVDGAQSNGAGLRADAGVPRRRRHQARRAEGQRRRGAPSHATSKARTTSSAVRTQQAQPDAQPQERRGQAPFQGGDRPVRCADREFRAGRWAAGARLGRRSRSSTCAHLRDDRGLWRLPGPYAGFKSYDGGAGDGRGDERHRFPREPADFGAAGDRRQRPGCRCRSASSPRCNGGAIRPGAASVSV